MLYYFLWFLYSCIGAVFFNTALGQPKFGAFGYLLGFVCTFLLHHKFPSLFFGDNNADFSHIRGAKIVSNSKLLALSKKEKHVENPVTIANIAVPFALENRHFLFVGSPGTGKSQLFLQVAKVARQRGNGAVIADLDGELTADFYREGLDVLLSPFDKRSPAWSPLAEMEGVWDADRVAKSIIADGEGSSKEWNKYAQFILSAVLLKIWQSGGNNGDLVHYLMFSKNEDLKALCDGSEASRMFEDGAERMLSSILSIVSSFAKTLNKLDKNANADSFSITKFVKENAEKNTGKWLFMPVRDDMFPMLSPLIAAQVDIAISALLTSKNDDQRRVFFFVDEFATWGKIEGIEPLLTKARKKGGCAVLGLQNVSQARENYGKERSQTLLSSCGTWLTLRSTDGDTAEFLSRNIGDEDIRRVINSSSDQGSSTSEQFSKQRVILPSELQKLPDLEGVLNIAGPLPAGWVSIKYMQPERNVEPFDLKDERSIEKFLDEEEQESVEIETDGFIP